MPEFEIIFYEKEDGTKVKVVEVIVEKLTFLSSKKTEPKEIDG